MIEEKRDLAACVNSSHLLITIIIMIIITADVYLLRYFAVVHLILTVTLKVGKLRNSISQITCPRPPGW